MDNQKNPLIFIYFISFVDLFAIGLTFPLLAPHLRDLGASHTLIGVLSSLYAGIQVVSGPLIGGWTDIKGRKTVLKKVLLVSGICYGLLGITESFFVIILLRIALGVIKHIQSICKAMIIDILPQEKQTDAFGKSAAISSLGFILAPLLGGHISEMPNGFNYVCLLTMLLFFVNIGFTSYLPDGSKNNNNNNNNATPNKRNNVLKTVSQEIGKSIKCLQYIDWSKYWGTFALRFLFGLAMTTFLTNQGLLLKEKYMLSQKHSGYVISYFSTIGTCSAFFLEKTSHVHKNDDYYTKLLVFFIIMKISVIAIYLAPNIIIHLCALVPFSVSSTALRILSMALILHESDGFHNGTLSGASNSVMSISRFISPLIIGILGDALGEETVVLVSAVPALAGVFLCLHLKACRRAKHFHHE